MASPRGKPDDEAGSAPKLDAMSLNESFGLFDGLSIVGAIHRFKPREMAVGVNEICPVFRHSFHKVLPALAASLEEFRASLPAEFACIPPSGLKRIRLTKRP